MIDWSRFLLVLAIWISFQKSCAQSISSSNDFDSYIQANLAQWQVPGLAIGVVKDGKVIFSEGYGKKDQFAITPNNQVTEQTIFAMASTTKAMTAVLLAMLVEENKISWDTQVHKLLPNLKLSDNYVQNELVVRDLLTHNSGLGNTDFLWYGQKLTEDEIVGRLEQVPLSYSFRSSFIYQNIMYLLAGQVIEAVTEKPWAEVIQERIFNPLEMRHTYTGVVASEVNRDRAKAHYIINKKIESIKDTNADAIAPAGGVWSNIPDFEKWMMMLLAEGQYKGQQLIQPESLKEIFRPHVIVPSKEFYPTALITKPNWMTYGLGWFQQDYLGEILHFHTGSLPGTVALVALIPSKNFGVVVLANRDHAEIRHALMFKAIDLFTDLPDKNLDWSKLIFDLYQDKSRTVKVQQDKDGLEDHPLELALYTGKFFDPLFGFVEVAKQDQQLYLNFNDEMEMIMSHTNLNTFEGHWEPSYNGKNFVSFELNPEGRVDRLKIDNMTFRKVSQ